MKQKQRHLLMAALCAGALSITAAPAARAASADEAIGVWLTKSGSYVKFFKCGARLCGKIIKRRKPNQLDSKNKNPKLRHRKILGINLLFGLVKDKPNRWKGKLYNPEDGAIYAGYVTVQSHDRVKMSGCWTMGFPCKSQVWKRVK